MHLHRDVGSGYQLQRCDEVPVDNSHEDRSHNDLHRGAGNGSLPGNLHRCEHHEQLHFAGLHLERRLHERRHALLDDEWHGHVYLHGDVGSGYQLQRGDEVPVDNGHEDRSHDDLHGIAGKRAIQWYVHGCQLDQRIDIALIHVKRRLHERRHALHHDERHDRLHIHSELGHEQQLQRSHPQPDDQCRQN